MISEGLLGYLLLDISFISISNVPEVMLILPMLTIAALLSEGANPITVLTTHIIKRKLHMAASPKIPLSIDEMNIEYIPFFFT